MEIAEQELEIAEQELEIAEQESKRRGSRRNARLAENRPGTTLRDRS